MMRARKDGSIKRYEEILDVVDGVDVVRRRCQA